MLTKILTVFAMILAMALIVVALQPPAFRITRSASITAPASAVFEQVNDFHKWEAWSPWAKLDPEAKESFEGPSSGIGSIFRWAGNKEVGEGSMTITESHPHDVIRMNLDFLKPFKANNVTEFIFRSEGDQTVVTWSMSGKNNFLGKAMSLIMNCDKMVGGQFEKGLAEMKSILEAAPQTTL